MIDSHVNLHHEAFGPDLEAVLARADQAGVHAMLTICDKMASLPAIAAISAQHSHIWHSVGVHPHYADEHQHIGVEDLLAGCNHAKAIGVGETGLDFHYGYSGEAEQVRLFRVHIEVARQTGLPLIVHTRQADDLTADILESEMEKGPFKILLHCYTSGLDLLARGLKLGAYVSFSGIATFKNAHDVRAAVAQVPLDRVLIETDCPYLAPVPVRGQRNEPAFLPHVSQFLASLYAMAPEAFADQADRNFLALFEKAAG
ncbi:D-aminoacyl-tRNA deacylase [Candidatus Phycosocius bacilliformis]|uniref:D-aminoacyl-tRNA deacylase n=1 Tax=Candidatus Phycosocius bacilliformis TaxID=1445552 RepID=A0A2P2E7Y7_9PROT|nr:TatD family hydrolase [Candidatus Phycosocius bacilliformis]GBF57176.1 D-aminoacyl-tRNA deacylase [Candidatus Phycosocius bacilliformis]